VALFFFTAHQLRDSGNKLRIYQYRNCKIGALSAHFGPLEYNPIFVSVPSAQIVVRTVISLCSSCYTWFVYMPVTMVGIK